METKWETTVCYFDENRKVISIQKLQTGEYVKDRKESWSREEGPGKMKKIINWYCRRNPQTQIKFG